MGPVNRLAGGTSFETSLAGTPHTLQLVEDVHAKAVAP
jgi:hypothetical protein